ncbi:MAG: hypothetical protein KBS83_04820, partial [Lachnospiraceae bacterium]|nr:hypothetical protein [Candidatus Equihabitans merdae]
DDRITAPLAASAKDEEVLIIGSNSKLGLIVNELPLQVKEVVMAGNRHQEEKAAMCKKIRGDIRYTLVNEDVMDFDKLAELVEDIDHVIVLSDYSYDEETSDIRNMMLIMNLRELRIRHDQTFSITSEMRRDDNRVLVTGSESIDFIVSTNMSSMVLAQVALEPMLYDTFHELLSNEGSEFLLKEAGILENCVGVEKTVAELRRAAIHEDGILLGYITKEEGREKTYINPELSKEVTLKAEDKLIVIMKD